MSKELKWRVATYGPEAFEGFAEMYGTVAIFVDWGVAAANNHLAAFPDPLALGGFVNSLAEDIDEDLIQINNIKYDSYLLYSDSGFIIIPLK